MFNTFIKDISKPFISFSLKNINNNINNYKTKENTTGDIRHFPPANKEWINSAYFYNKNTMKSMPIADKAVNKLIKGYFNLSQLIQKKRSKRIQIRFRRLSLNRILVSKSEIKHSNNKAIITVYLYNRKKKLFMRKITNMFNIFIRKIFNSGPVYIRNYRFKHSKYSNFFKTLNIGNRFFERKIERVHLKSLKFIKKIKKYKNFILKVHELDMKGFKDFEANFYERFFNTSYKKELLHMYYMQMLLFNDYKFKNWFLIGLKSLLGKIYNKNIELNLVNLKYLHLNSDIYSESIAIKLKKRKNKLLRVLKKALKLAKLPTLTKDIFYNNTLHKTFINKYKNINLYISYVPKEKDALHQILYKTFPIRSKYHTLPSNNLENNILNYIKYKNISGLRIEAAGRLSKRLTASRSVFKYKYKGSLKNVDSSDKNMSSVMMKGYLKSNIQFTKLNSKTRNGAFGLKTWISSY